MFKLAEVKIRRRTWLQTSNIPTRHFGKVLDDCQDAPKKALEDVRRWIGAVADGKVIRVPGGPLCGKGLLMYGLPGRGKTTVALAAIQEMMTTLSPEAFAPSPHKVLVRPCYFITFNDLLELKGATMNSDSDVSDDTLYNGILGDSKDDAYNVRVLVLDDVGKEHASLSGWQKNMLHHVLRTRFNHGLPTIVTTNISREDWVQVYGDATGSFAKEAFAYVPISQENRDLR